MFTRLLLDRCRGRGLIGLVASLRRPFEVDWTRRRSLKEIILAAGGAKAISDASGGKLSKDAIYKWPAIGIPDRHWSLLIRMADSSPDELYRANKTARKLKERR